MITIQNPVLTGFHPDPSLICVGDDFYLATSTFEWYPGVQIYHSKNLRDWKLAARPLTRSSQLNLLGENPSGGVWAPCLSFCDGKFYLIYSDVKNVGTFYDVHNYLVTAEHIEGPWSEPIYMNASGFDPSLFHDDDGRKWFVNMHFDYRTWHVRFNGIVLQEFSEEQGCLIGEPKVIYDGTPARTVEGPHIYKRNGWYYLFCAEGGTCERHQETVLRCREIDGNYELCPHNPLITSYPYPNNPLQKAGHASMAQGSNGEWYLAHLCGRPVNGEYCILGRETAIQKLVWKNDWPMLASGDDEPLEAIEADFPETKSEAEKSWMDDFDGNTWNERFQSLRIPLGKRASLTERSGWLRLYGAESLESCYEQSLLAFRQQYFYEEVETKLEFEPSSYQQMAGLTYYYDTLSHYYLYVTADEKKGRVISFMQKILGKFSQPIGAGVSIPETGAVWLKLSIDYDEAQYAYSLDGVHYQNIGPILDAIVLSDDYYQKINKGRFTGAFVGICCQDISGRRKAADFDYVRCTVNE